jgi:hypothetical protein
MKRKVLIGMLTGQLAFAAVFVVWLVFDIRWLMPVAMPIALGGWLFIWGDGPQPPQFVNSRWFAFVTGLVIYGAIGALAGRLYQRRLDRIEEAEFHP